MIFPKDEGVGYWKSGEIQIWKSPPLGNFFILFLGQENTKNDHLSLMWQRFTFPQDFSMEKHFGKTNSAFMQSKQEKPF